MQAVFDMYLSPYMMSLAFTMRAVIKEVYLAWCYPVALSDVGKTGPLYDDSGTHVSVPQAETA